VSGFAAPLSNLPELDEFNRSPLQSDRLIRCCGQRTVFASRDDKIVASHHSQALSEQLQARLHLVDKAGHFLAADGFLQLPAVLTELQRMLSNASVHSA